MKIVVLLLKLLAPLIEMWRDKQLLDAGAAKQREKDRDALKERVDKADSLSDDITFLHPPEERDK